MNRSRIFLSIAVLVFFFCIGVYAQSRDETGADSAQAQTADDGDRFDVTTVVAPEDGQVVLPAEVGLVLPVSNYTSSITLNDPEEGLRTYAVGVMSEDTFLIGGQYDGQDDVRVVVIDDKTYRIDDENGWKTDDGTDLKDVYDFGLLRDRLDSEALASEDIVILKQQKVGCAALMCERYEIRDAKRDETTSILVEETTRRLVDYSLDGVLGEESLQFTYGELAIVAPDTSQGAELYDFSL